MGEFMIQFLLQTSGYFAYLSAGATGITFLTGIMFFSIGKPFGKINDISSVLQVVSMIPLTALFASALPSQPLFLGWIAALLGAAGMLVSAVGQSLLVLGVIDFQESKKFFPAGGAIGLWLILVCLIGSGSGQLEGFTFWPGLLAGAGYLATVISFLAGGQDHPVFYLGGSLLGISYPIWAVALGRILTIGGL
jgi:hypothetical protein